MQEDKHDKAVDLTEQALDAMEEGDRKEAEKLVSQAKKIDPSAVDEVVHDLEEAENTSVETAKDK